jgi:peptide/nickel transport system substrate-binding protein
MTEPAHRATVADSFSGGQTSKCCGGRSRRRWDGSRTPLLAWLVVAAALAACREPPAHPPGYAVVGLEAAPLSYDPRVAADANSLLVNRLVYQGLVGFSATGEAVAELAESWTRPDPLTYRFVLRPARFHTGEPVTAKDVVATYRSLGNPLLHAPRLGALDFVTEIVAEDERTVRFTLREPFAPFLDAMTLGIVPASCAMEAECPVGSGPFRLADREVDRIVLTAAATADPPPRLPGIVFRVSPDSVVRALELARGTIDLAENAVDPEIVGWLAQRGLEVMTTPGSTFQYLGFNLQAAPLGDPRVRRAIALAIDRDAIIAHLLKGYARPASQLLPPEHWAYDPGVATYAYAPERARELLDEAGFPASPDDGFRFRLTYKTSTVDLRRRIAEAIAAGLRAVGIEVQIRTLEWATLYADIRRGNFELFSLAWVGVNDPDHYFGMLHSSMTPPRGNNRGAYSSPAIDELTTQGRQESEPARRRVIYGEIAEKASDELPYVPLWWAANVVVKTPRLAGFVPSPMGDLRGLAAAYWRDGQP